MLQTLRLTNSLVTITPSLCANKYCSWIKRIAGIVASVSVVDVCISNTAKVWRNGLQQWWRPTDFQIAPPQFPVQVKNYVRSIIINIYFIGHCAKINVLHKGSKVSTLNKNLMVVSNQTQGVHWQGSTTKGFCREIYRSIVLQIIYQEIHCQLATTAYLPHHDHSVLFLPAFNYNYQVCYQGGSVVF